MDFDDFALDNFDDFFALEPRIVFSPSPFLPTIITRADKTRSWKWFAPAGCSIFAIDHEGGTVDEARTLVGEGTLHQDSNLKFVLNDGGTDDIDQEVDAVKFLKCRQYYATPFNLQWDLDLNGSFETTAFLVSFSAAALDGPSEVAVPAQARHPLGGSAGQTLARVHVRNVAPQLTQFRVTDSAGQQVNIDVPFVLTKVPVIAGAGFSDPGVLDHQTATLAWGDGSVEPQTAFTTFDEAFGDATGAVSHTHRYTLAGSYPIALSVSDDDGGVDTDSLVVRVVTLEQAVEEIVDLLDGIIAVTTDKGMHKNLKKARRALAGGCDGGALAKIRAGNHRAPNAHLRQAIDKLRKAAAIAHLHQAIDRLQKAQEGGAAVAALIALLQQVIVALSAA